ncbi:MAG: hypothetical protein ABI083_01900 [Lapillicoccus sp.]
MSATRSLLAAAALALLAPILASPTSSAAPTSASTVTAGGYAYTVLIAQTALRDIGGCSLNDSGQVAMVARERATTTAPWRPKVLRLDGATTTTIMTTRQGLGPSIEAVINNLGQVAVRTGSGNSLHAPSVILEGDGGPVTVVANTGTGQPLTGQGLGLSIGDNGRVAFVGTTSTSYGIYTATRPSDLKTRYLNTDIASSFGYVSSPQLNASGQIAFNQNDANRVQGVYRVEPGGAVTRLYQAPRASSQIASPTSMNRAGRVAFVTAVSPRLPRTLYTTQGGPLTLVASAADGLAPFSASINDGGVVAFRASRGGGSPGLYVGSTPSFASVVQIGDVIGGGQVSDIWPCDRMLNNAGQVAFLASLRNGPKIIVRADPLP